MKCASMGEKFFISFNAADKDKADWFAWTLKDGDLNRSTQHLLILLDEEVADGDVTDIVHGEAEG